MDGSPGQAFGLDIAGRQFSNHGASSNRAPDQFKHAAPDRVDAAVECSRRELNQSTRIGKQRAAVNGKPEHFHDAGDDTQRIAMRKSAGRRNAEWISAE